MFGLIVPVGSAKMAPQRGINTFTFIDCYCASSLIELFAHGRLQFSKEMAKNNFQAKTQPNSVKLRSRFISIGAIAPGDSCAEE